MKNAAYLEATWHHSTRPVRLLLEQQQEWLGLQVISTKSVGNAATVEFKARSRIGGRSHMLHEVSRFVHEGGRWFYVDGMIT
jgi:SEC-C motif domain protein